MSNPEITPFEDQFNLLGRLDDMKREFSLSLNARNARNEDKADMIRIEADQLLAEVEAMRERSESTDQAGEA